MSGQRLAFGLRAKWAAFRTVEWLSEARARLTQGNANAPVRANPAPPFGEGAESAWIFVSTIGELNAVEPFLSRFVEAIRPTPITLLTDRLVYRESYLAKYPSAYVYEIDGTSADVKKLLRLTPPRLLLIAEIPCLPSDAPCRFPFAAVYEAKARGVPVILVNGWLYGDGPGSRLDALERRLFQRDYVRLMDLITVQHEDARRRMLEAGAGPQRVLVTGNTKFDAVRFQPWSWTGARSEVLLRSIAESGRPCVVAGCVTDHADQRMILAAFQRVLERIPDALLVLAPRHPEKKDRTAALEALIQERPLRGVFRTRIGDVPLDPGVQCLVLDTMGELRDFYGIASVAYVGRDHNILEPLSLDKPVTISPGWEPRYPSYPVYRLLLEVGAVCELTDDSSLAGEWIRLLSNPGAHAARTRNLRDTLERLKGASAKNLELVLNVVGRRPPQASRRALRTFQ